MQKFAIFSLILLLTLTACGGGGESVESTISPATEPTPNATEEIPATEEAAAGSTEEASIDATQEVSETWVCPEGFEGQTLSVYNWEGYIGENTVADFEAACGVTVTYEIYDSDEDLIESLSEGNPGYDVAFPSDYGTTIIVRQGLGGEINIDKIPNFKNTDPSMINRHFDPGNRHSVPYVWGTTAIAFNRTRMETPLDGWDAFFKYQGPTAWIDVPRVMIGGALFVLGKDPNSANQQDIREAKEYLLAHVGDHVRVAGDDGDELLASGEVDAVVEYSGDIHQQMVDCGCTDFVYLLPKEGAFFDISSVILLKDAPNPDLAHAWMDYLLHPRVASDITNDIGYPTANRAAIESGFIAPEVFSDPSITPPQQYIWQMRLIIDIGDNAEQNYNQAWEEIKAAIGE